MRSMNWTRRLATTLLSTLAFAALAACSGDGTGEPTTGSESHFLEACEATRDCAEGLACHCGICTISCAGDNACQTLGEGLCAPSLELDDGCATSVSWADGICMTECSADADCGPQMRCTSTGWCQREELPEPTADAGGEDAFSDTSGGCNPPYFEAPEIVEYAQTTDGAAPPYLSEGHVYFSRDINDDASGGSLEAFRVDSTTYQEERLTQSTQREVVHGAAGGKVLLFDRRAEPTPLLSIYDLATQTRQEQPYSDQYGTPFFSSDSGEAQRFFDGQRLLFRDEEGTLQLVDVESWSTLGSASALGDLSVTSRPVLTPYGFAFAARPADSTDEASDIYLYGGPDADWRTGKLTDNGEKNRWPFADGDDLYWVSDKAVYVAKNSPTAERIHEGRCGPPHAHDGRAVFACNEVGESPIGTQYGKAVYVYDGQTTRQIASFDGDTFAYAPRIGEHGVVWFEYDETDALCNGRPGRLFYYDLGHQRGRVIDEVGAPCMCCGRYSPPVSLHIEGDVVAWNYAGFTSFGYAKIRRGAVCQ